MEIIKDEIIDNNILNNIKNHKIDSCICKILIKIENEYEYDYEDDFEYDYKEEPIECIGFFCEFKQRDFKILICDDLSEEILDDVKKLECIINGEKKEIILGINRYKYFDEQFNYAIIEILEEDNISHFFEIDEDTFNMDYKDKLIFSPKLDKGETFKYIQGKNINKKEGYLFCSFNDEEKLSGYPIILLDNMKIIGLHIKNKIDDKNISIDLIIDKMNFIKCVFNIKKEDIGKKIALINENYNKEYEDKLKIIIKGVLLPVYLEYIFEKF